jgi:NAD(P)-dependent dehydrogenase (short-subunit alcohol dehydrogenase family)
MSRILITGSNSGFGKLAALSLARAGHDVIATMRNLAKGDDLSRSVAAEGLSIEVRRLDVCDPASVAGARGDAAEIAVLVNNAGFEVQGAVELVDDDLMRAQFDTNVLGPMRLVRSVLPAWRARGHGTIVNVSSLAGVVGAPFGGVYAASKHALEALSEALHFETSQLGIRVRLIEPGRFETDFSSNIVPVPGWEQSFYFERSQRFRESLTALDGEGPEPDPQDVADAIVAAATDPATPFRTFVGGDAELISSVKAALPFEEFEQTMRTTLDWHE